MHITPPPPTKSSKYAFSLVELSIVLVILGLLTGGILAGQSLIRASELRAVSTEYDRYKTALLSFRDKYLALPGDMPNATQFWGAAHATLATCVVTVGTGTQTCNGNGDGRINIGAAPVANNSYEDFRSWQQLANAGLVEGSYTGVQASAAIFHSVIGSNVPGSKISNAGWFLHYIGSQVSGGGFFPGNYETGLYFGTSTAASFPYGPVFKPEEAWNIDTKLDDGKPAQGAVRMFETIVAANCVTSDNPSTADYIFTQTARTCPMIFMSGQ